jgi:hypothetical protein
MEPACYRIIVRGRLTERGLLDGLCDFGLEHLRVEEGEQ